VVPARIELRALQRIERAVDLQGVEDARCVAQLEALRQAGRVEHAAPRCVAPSRNADAYGCHGEGRTSVAAAVYTSNERVCAFVPTGCRRNNAAASAFHVMRSRRRLRGSIMEHRYSARFCALQAGALLAAISCNA